jgi:chromosome segregation ATPase
MSQYNDDLHVLITCLATTFGDEVGQAVQEKFNSLIQLEGIDVAALQAQINALNNILNNSTEAATVQSILTQLAAFGTRLNTLESSTAVADLAVVVASAQAAIAAETARAQAAEAALAASITTINTTLGDLAAEITALQNAPQPQACDCAALTASIAAQATQIANLQAVDSATAAQIAALQSSVEALHGQAAAIAAAQATADAASAAAAAAATQAASAAASAAAANAGVTSLTAAVAQLTTDNNAAHNTFVTKVEIQNIDCVLVGQAFRGAMRNRMFPNPSNGY